MEGSGGFSKIGAAIAKAATKAAKCPAELASLSAVSLALASQATLAGKTCEASRCQGQGAFFPCAPRPGWLQGGAEAMPAVRAARAPGSSSRARLGALSKWSSGSSVRLLVGSTSISKSRNGGARPSGQVQPSAFLCRVCSREGLGHHRQFQKSQQLKVSPLPREIRGKMKIAGVARLGWPSSGRATTHPREPWAKMI